MACKGQQRRFEVNHRGMEALNPLKALKRRISMATPRRHVVIVRARPLYVDLGIIARLTVQHSSLPQVMSAADLRTADWHYILTPWRNIRFTPLNQCAEASTRMWQLLKTSGTLPA